LDSDYCSLPVLRVLGGEAVIFLGGLCGLGGEAFLSLGVLRVLGGSALAFIGVHRRQ
jgi:hypothetical protein